MYSSSHAKKNSRHYEQNVCFWQNIGSVGTPPYILGNDPHDTMIILNMHKWGKIFSKKIAHQLRLPSAKVQPEGRVGVKSFFCPFLPILNSPQNSEYFEYRHIGANKKNAPCRMPNKKSPAPLARTKPIDMHNHLGVCRGGGGYPPPFGVGA